LGSGLAYKVFCVSNVIIHTDSVAIHPFHLLGCYHSHVTVHRLVAATGSEIGVQNMRRCVVKVQQQSIACSGIY